MMMRRSAPQRPPDRRQIAEIDVHGSYVGSDRFGRLRGALGATAAARDLDAKRVSRFCDFKAETGGPPNDDEVTVSCRHELSCVCRFVSEFKVVLDHACHHGQTFCRDPGAAGSNDVRQFRAFSLALLMGLS